MGSYNKKRILIVCISLISSIFLTAAIFHRVEILGDKPLIDLDELLGEDPFGQQGSTDGGSSLTDKDKDEDSSAESSSDTEKKDAADKTDAVEAMKGSVTIGVRGKSITCKGKTYTYNKDTGSVAGLDSLLEDIKDARAVVLKDNLAEAHAFRFIIDSIRKIGVGVEIVSPVLLNR